MKSCSIWAAAISSVWIASICHATLPQLPKVDVMRTLTFLPKDPSTHKPLQQTITFSAAEGLPSADAATQLCNQLERAPSLQPYNLTEILSNCVVDITHSLDEERGRLLMVNPDILKGIAELNTALSAGAGATSLPPNLSNEYVKLSFLQNVMQQQPQLKNVCLVGFGAGHAASAYLALRHDIKIVAFDVGEENYVVPAHDLLDSKYKDRLTLYLGDTGVTIPRFTLINPDFKCDVVHIDQSASPSAMRMALLDFRPTVDLNNHIVLIDTPMTKDQINANRIQQQLNAFRQFGALKLHGKVSERITAEVIPYIDEMILGSFTSTSATS